MMCNIEENEYLIQGIQCKACNKGLGAADDPELCGECMAVVTDCNKDLNPPDKYELEEGEFEYVGDALDAADVSLEEYERNITGGQQCVE